jgi:uncharacterized iron-regulated protein
MKRHRPSRLALLRRTTGLLLVGALAGCRTLPPPAAAVPAGPERAFFDGRTGQPLDWTALTARLGAADFILVGEQHDNVAGHRLEAELADALLQQTPNAAIALEMFERDEQGFVDAYLDGRIAAATLVTLTESENWGGGKNTWMEWYQPIVDHVKARRASGAALIAANAPRAYVKLARLESFAALDQLPASDRALFQAPDLAVDDHAYRERFLATMQQHSAPAKAGQPAPKTKSAASADTPPAPKIDPDAFLRAQQVWDATMAESVLLARTQHSKVMLFVGEFHLGFAGGTLQRVRHGAPDSKIATISILRSDTPETFAAGDKDRADLVVYTRAK